MAWTKSIGMDPDHLLGTFQFWEDLAREECRNNTPLKTTKCKSRQISRYLEIYRDLFCTVTVFSFALVAGTNS
jgi:hypothetical protein